MFSASDFLTSFDSEHFTIATLVVLALSKGEFEAFSNPNYIIINTVVIIDKSVYVNTIESLLTDQFKFVRVDIPPGKDINFIVNIENRLKSAIKGMLNNGYIDNATYKKLSPTGPNLMFFMVWLKFIKNPKMVCLLFDLCPPR